MSKTIETLKRADAELVSYLKDVDIKTIDIGEIEKDIIVILNKHDIKLHSIDFTYDEKDEEWRIELFVRSENNGYKKLYFLCHLIK
ncbi:hypothetical protein M0R36_10590 [bacterium]|jgi:hypothetical protein|nr:hypothetical protein [bacterium]